VEVHKPSKASKVAAEIRTTIGGAAAKVKGLFEHKKKDDDSSAAVTMPTMDGEDETSSTTEDKSSESTTSSSSNSDEAGDSAKKTSAIQTKLAQGLEKAKEKFANLKKDFEESLASLKSEKTDKSAADEEVSENEAESADDADMTDSQSSLTKLGHALLKLNDGELKDALTDIYDMAVNDLENNKDIKTAGIVCDKSANLINSLTDSSLDESQKKAAIKQYREDLSSSRFMRFLKAIAVVGLAALGFIVGAGVGTGIGMAAGAWSGPGAAATGVVGLFTGAATGAAAGLLTGTVATGLGAAAVGGALLFKPNKLERAVNRVADEAKASLKAAASSSAGVASDAIDDVKTITPRSI
jgi:hypothetical protein